jgi:hypothetical protein
MRKERGYDFVAMERSYIVALKEKKLVRSHCWVRVFI